MWVATPYGSFPVELTHVEPDGAVSTPGLPDPPSFRPPTIFSAPLPSGSGARALGVAGAWTAIADDATAASWNPGGLIQLETPEVSIVGRFSREEQDHRSETQDYRVGEDDFDNAALNYLSFVYPFSAFSRNVVVSLNFQEAYDFRQTFHARTFSADSQGSAETTVAAYSETSVVSYQTGDQAANQTVTRISITNTLTTRVTSYLQRLLDSEAVTELDFEQQGVIDAVTPALAIELSPKLSIGCAVNFFGDNTFGDNRIRSRTRAAYEGTSSSSFPLQSDYVTSGSYTYGGSQLLPPGGGMPQWTEQTFGGSGIWPAFGSAEFSTSGRDVAFEGVYEEINEYEDLFGWNCTLGALWTVSRHLSLGASLDLPWTAEAEQTRTVRNTITTYDAARARVLDVSTSESTVTKDVEFEFPLQCAFGGVWRWSDLLHTSCDLRYTRWSDFAFQAEGEEKIGPLDGSRFGEHDVHDCWAVNAGAEYLLLFERTEVPLRGGAFWEQRPAVGEPDEYWGLSLGTGVSIGRRHPKVIFDIAYVFTWGDDVLGSLVPDQDGLSSDVQRHQCFLSCICHL